MFFKQSNNIFRGFLNKSLLIALVFLLFFNWVEASDPEELLLVNEIESEQEAPLETGEKDQAEIEVGEEDSEKEKTVPEEKEIEPVTKIEAKKEESTVSLVVEDDIEEEVDENEDKKCTVENRDGLDKIYLNELLPDPLSDDLVKKKEEERIELYNSGDKEVDIGGCCLVDGRYSPEEKNSVEKCFFIKKNEKIDSKEFKVFKRTEFGFDMNKNIETIFLLDENGNELDKIYYKSSEVNLSCSLDFKGNWRWVEPTFGAINVFPIPKIYSKKIEITEFLPNPEGADGNKEWVELFSSDIEDIKLDDWYFLVKAIQSDSVGKQFKLDGLEIIPGQRLKIEIDSKTSFLRNSNGQVDLIDPNDKVVDSIDYMESAKKNFSYALSLQGTWQWTEILTPGEINQFPVPKSYSKKIEITELMPNADGVDKDQEWIELSSGDVEDLDLDNWYFLNQSNQEFKLDGGVIKAKKKIKIEIKNSSFSLRNSDGRVDLVDPNGDVVDTVSYQESAKEDSSYNKNFKGEWSWSIFSTPGAENKFNSLPTYQVEIPDEIYEDVKVEFKIKETEDKDGESLKYRWDFGDNKKSYLKETTHTFSRKGNYTVQTRVGDLSIDIFKNFKITVKKFPKLDLRIIRLLPNPEGSDNDNEKIWIENREKETINMKGWVIATGSSMNSLTNHYIKGNFKIKAGKVRSLNRVDCAFSLLNKKGRVILKAPNGKVVDKVKYEKDKIVEDELYFLENDAWKWETPIEVKIKKSIILNEVDLNQTVAVLGEKSSITMSQILSNSFLNRTDHLKAIIFDNWLFSKSKNPFFKFIFATSYRERV